MPGNDVDSPLLPSAKDRLKAAILSANERHLKRTKADAQAAWDLTYYHLKHFGYSEAEWDYIVEVLETIRPG